MKENLIKKKTFEFALSIIALYVKMKDKNEFVLSKQLLRSGTSIGANVEEADAAQSKKEFHAKMSIASKEARETKYWLRLIQSSNIINESLNDLLKEIDEINNILTKIVKTTSERMSENRKSLNI